MREPTFDDLDYLAGELYRFFQTRLEEPIDHRIVAATGTYEDANDYTRQIFREGVRAVLRQWSVIETTASEEG